MIIKYRRTKEEKLCKNEYKAIKQLGRDVAQDLFDLIDAIENSATSLKDIQLPQYRLHPLLGNKKGLYSLTISNNSKYRIEFIPLDENFEKAYCNNDLNTFYKSIKNIEIIEISEHYDK